MIRVIAAAALASVSIIASCTAGGLAGTTSRCVPPTPRWSSEEKMPHPMTVVGTRRDDSAPGCGDKFWLELKRNKDGTIKWKRVTKKAYDSCRHLNDFYAGPKERCK